MELVSKFGFTREDAQLIVSSVANNAVNLLLGAGGSYGATGGDGAILKGGVDLARELNANFSLGLDKSEEENLPLVYGDIESSSKTKAPLNSFLRTRFTGCKPTWQKKLHEFRWKRIWTLNIDDVIERSKDRSREPKLETYVWSDPYRPRPLDKSNLQVIYLHGKASRLTEEPNHLIFSLKEYAPRNENSPGWHAEFRSEWVKKPFIVCGARLQEEFDLITVLDFGNMSRERGGCPSVVVLSSMTQGQRARFIRQGLIPVESLGDAFFESLHIDVLEYQAQFNSESPQSRAAREEVRARFKKLSVDEIPPKKLLDFYSSAETQWPHILQSLDAQLSGSSESASWLIKPSTNKVRIALFHGGSVSGKSASAMRTAHHLLERGYEIYQFRGEERFKEQDLVEYSKNGNIVFVFDDCADLSNSIKAVISLAKESNTTIRIIATCDTHRLRAVRADVIDADRLEVPLQPLLKKDFLSVFIKRSEKGRLGTRSGLSLNQAWKEFDRSYNSQLLEWLESLENAHSYRLAITDMLENPGSLPRGAIPLIVATAAVHRLGYSLPFDIADSFVSAGNVEKLFDEDSPINQIGYLDNNGLRLRSSAFSEYVWKLITVEQKYSISLTIVKKLAPLVVPQSIARRSLAYLIVRGLMDHDLIKRDIGKMADKWYSELESVCGWNARFWEQRALLASSNDQESLAYSYAKKAVSVLEHDSFPHTTLGKVCVKIGVSRRDQVGVARFWEGVEELKISRDLSASNGLEWEHPYITFFTYAMRAVVSPHFENEREKLSAHWGIWMKAAKNSETLIFDDEGRSQLEEFQRQWLIKTVAVS